MTVGQLFLGLVTIFTATFVYRWQKNVDRQTERQKVQLEAYTAYLSALKAHCLSQPFIGDTDVQEKAEKFRSLSDDERQLYCLRDKVFLLGSDEVVKHLDVCDRAFRNWKIAFNSEDQFEDHEAKREVVKQAYKELLSAELTLSAAIRKEIQQYDNPRFFSFSS